ncbi:MAG TPA: ABC transporter permease, partial [Glaciihabitans sp.]|nr:ABC transporter permease [Glaciihabitans sp.]
MTRYLLTRLWQSAITLILASLVVFIGVRQLPGDPALAMAGEEASPERLAEIRTQLGLDESLVNQYFSFIGNMLRG